MITEVYSLPPQLLVNLLAYWNNIKCFAVNERLLSTSFIEVKTPFYFQLIVNSVDLYVFLCFIDIDNRHKPENLNELFVKQIHNEIILEDENNNENRKQQQ